MSYELTSALACRVAVPGGDGVERTRLPLDVRTPDPTALESTCDVVCLVPTASELDGHVGSVESQTLLARIMLRIHSSSITSTPESSVMFKLETGDGLLGQEALDLSSISRLVLSVSLINSSNHESRISKTKLPDLGYQTVREEENNRSKLAYGVGQILTQQNSDILPELLDPIPIFGGNCVAAMQKNPR